MTPLLVKSGTTSDLVYNFKWKALLVHILVASWHSKHFSTELPLRTKFIHTVSIYLISIYTKCVHKPPLDGASALCTANVIIEYAMKWCFNSAQDCYNYILNTLNILTYCNTESTVYMAAN